MQTVKRTHQELDDRALLHHLVPPSPEERESYPLQSVPVQENGTSDDHLTEAEADEIFSLAEQEIQPLLQPLLRKAARDRWRDRIQAAFCLCLILAGLIGTVYQAVTFPHTLVVLYAREQPTSITTTLALLTRTLAPVTITRSQTTSTTGHGHQDAARATGTLTFYNGLFTAQSVPQGTVFVANTGVKIATDVPLTIPAADPTTTPPQLGYATIASSAVEAGAGGNIAAYAINGAIGNGISVKNTSSFQHGQDARSYQAVAPQDLQTVTSTVNQTVTQAFTTAFPVQQGEEAVPTTCHMTTTPTHQVGEEATSVTVTTIKICSAVAYSRQQLASQATAAFMQTKPAAPYHLVGSVQTTLKSVTPLSVTINGKWAYTFTPAYEQSLAEKIEGVTPAQAQKVLLRTGVVAYASIPTTLPPAMYIDFLVLVG